MINYKGLLFKPWDESDIISMSKTIVESYESLSPWLDWVKQDYNEVNARQWVIACKSNWNRCRYFAVYKDDNLVGSISVTISNDKGFIGYWVGQPFQRQGICHIMMEMILKYSFNDLKLSSLFLDIAEDNIPSRKIAERFNGKLVKSKSSYIKVGNNYHDAVIYKIGVPYEL